MLFFFNKKVLIVKLGIDISLIFVKLFEFSCSGN